MALGRALRQVNGILRLLLSQSILERADREGVMAFPFAHRVAAHAQGDVAELEGGVVGVHEPAIRAQALYPSVRQFAVHETQQFLDLGKGRLVFQEIPALQPVL